VRPKRLNNPFFRLHRRGARPKTLEALGLALGRFRLRQVAIDAEIGAEKVPAWLVIRCHKLPISGKMLQDGATARNVGMVFPRSADRLDRDAAELPAVEGTPGWRFGALALGVSERAATPPVSPERCASSPT